MDASKLIDQLQAFYKGNNNINHKRNSSNSNLTRKSSTSSLENQCLPPNSSNSHHPNISLQKVQSLSINNVQNTHIQKISRQNGLTQLPHNNAHQINQNSQRSHLNYQPKPQKISSNSSLSSNLSTPTNSNQEILRQNILYNNDPLEHTRSLLKNRQDLLEDQYLYLVDMIKRVSKIQQSITGVTPPELQRFSDTQSLTFEKLHAQRTSNSKLHAQRSNNKISKQTSQTDTVSIGSGGSNTSPEKQSLPDSHSNGSIPGRTPMDQKEIESYKQLLESKDLRMKQVDGETKSESKSDGFVEREYSLNQEIISGWNACLTYSDKNNKNWLDSNDRINKRQAKIGEFLKLSPKNVSPRQGSPKIGSKISPKTGSPRNSPKIGSNEKLGSPKTKSSNIGSPRNGSPRIIDISSHSNSTTSTVQNLSHHRSQTSPDSRIVQDSNYRIAENQEFPPARFKTAQVRKINGLTVKPMHPSQDQMYQIMIRKNSTTENQDDQNSVNSDDTVAIWERHERKFGGPVSTNYRSNYTAGGRTFQLNVPQRNYNSNNNNNRLISNSNNNYNSNNSIMVRKDDVTPIQLQKFVDRMRLSRSNSKSNTSSITDSDNACEIQTDPEDFGSSTIQRNRDSKRWKG